MTFLGRQLYKNECLYFCIYILLALKINKVMKKNILHQLSDLPSFELLRLLPHCFSAQ